MEEKNGKEKWIYNIRNDDRDVDRSFTFVDYFAKYSTKRKVLYIKYKLNKWNNIGIKQPYFSPIFTSFL